SHVLRCRQVAATVAAKVDNYTADIFLLIILGSSLYEPGRFTIEPTNRQYAKAIFYLALNAWVCNLGAGNTKFFLLTFPSHGELYGSANFAANLSGGFVRCPASDLFSVH